MWVESDFFLSCKCSIPKKTPPSSFWDLVSPSGKLGLTQLHQFGSGWETHICGSLECSGRRFAAHAALELLKILAGPVSETQRATLFE